MEFPVWRLTRNRFVRTVAEVFARLGLRVSRLDLYARGTDAAVGRSPPDGLSIRTERGRASLITGGVTTVSDGDLVVAAVDGARTVGHLVLTHDRAVRVDPLGDSVSFDGAYLWELYVRPSFRRRGVATTLVEHAVSVAATDLGADRIYALVAPDNVPSRQVFETAGFEVVAAASYLRVLGLERRRWRGSTPRTTEN